MVALLWFFNLKNGQTSLHKACKVKDSEQRCELVEYLIKHKANINHQSQVFYSVMVCMLVLKLCTIAVVRMRADIGPRHSFVGRLEILVQG